MFLCEEEEDEDINAGRKTGVRVVVSKVGGFRIYIYVPVNLSSIINTALSLREHYCIGCIYSL